MKYNKIALLMKSLISMIEFTHSLKNFLALILFRLIKLVKEWGFPYLFPNCFPSSFFQIILFRI